MDILNETYYDPSTGLYSTVEKLYQKLKSRGITRPMIKDFIQKQENYQIHTTKKRITHYNPIKANHQNDIWQVDLMDMSDISTTNTNVKYLLCVVDVFTRFTYVEPLKNKNNETIVDTMDKLLKDNIPNVIMSDNGSEFISRNYKELMKPNKIRVYYVDVNDKKMMGIVERFNRTIRGLINKYLTTYKTTKLMFSNRLFITTTPPITVPLKLHLLMQMLGLYRGYYRTRN
jgi:IS30 family transposase